MGLLSIRTSFSAVAKTFCREVYQMLPSHFMDMVSTNNDWLRSNTSSNDKDGKEKQDGERKGDEENDEDDEDDEDGARLREAITSYFVQLCHHDSTGPKRRETVEGG